LRAVVDYGCSNAASLNGGGRQLQSRRDESNQLEPMETILNLVWLIVTVAAIWLWRFRWSALQPNPSYSTRMEAAAMVCFLALLFPVISLTDDLHPETAVVDAASGKRNSCLIAASAPHVRAATLEPGLHSPLGTISRPLAAVNLSVAEISPLISCGDPTSLASNLPGRSPPSFNRERQIHPPSPKV
jgi:hypothetical protein